jgi:hypothetical protein
MVVLNFKAMAKDADQPKMQRFIAMTGSGNALPIWETTRP